MSSSRSDWRCSKAYNETAFRVFVSGSCLLRVIPRFFIRIRFDITSKRYFRSLVAFFYFHPTSSSQTFISLNLQWQVVFFLFASWMLNTAPPCPAMGSSSKSIPRYFSHTSLHLWCKIRQIHVRFRVKTYRFFFLFFFSFTIYKRFEPVSNPNSRRALVPIATRVFQAARSVLVTRSRFTRFATIVIRTSYLSVSVRSSKVPSNEKQFSFGRKSRQAITG